MVYETASSNQHQMRDKWQMPTYRSYVRRSLHGGRLPEPGLTLEQIVEKHDAIVGDNHAEEPCLASAMPELRRAFQLVREGRL